MHPPESLGRLSTGKRQQYNSLGIHHFGDSKLTMNLRNLTIPALVGCASVVTQPGVGLHSRGDGGPMCGSLNAFPPSHEPHIAQLSLGFTHDCALMSDGSVRCRGVNSLGELGTGDLVPHFSPPFASVVGLPRAADVVVGAGAVTCARTLEGEVWCWGSNAHGMLGNNRVNDQVCGTPPSSSCRLVPTKVEGVREAVDLVISDTMVCALLRSGQVMCWGEVNFPSLGTRQSVFRPIFLPTVTNAIAIFPAYNSVAVVRPSGEIQSSDPTAVVRLPSGAAVETGNVGSHRYCYLERDRTVSCWGDNAFGVAGDGMAVPGTLEQPRHTGLRCVVSLSVSPFHTCAVSSDGHVACWGSTAHGESGSPTGRDERCVSSASSRSPCVLRPTMVSGISGALSVHLAPFKSCVILRDYSTQCWGVVNGFDRSTPVRVEW